MGFDLRKVFGIKKLNIFKTLGIADEVNSICDGVKTNMCDEIDRAIVKINNGEVASIITRQLSEKLSEIIAHVALPGAGMLVSIALTQFDWQKLIFGESTPKDTVSKLIDLKAKIRSTRIA